MDSALKVAVTFTRSGILIAFLCAASVAVNVFAQGDAAVWSIFAAASEGAAGAAAWGTRGRWYSLSGHTGDHAADIAIFDHPDNPGYPAYWHARGYGLFAANPLGRSIFDPGQPSLNLTLEKGESATFRYRVIILSRGALPAQLNREADAFAAGRN